MRHVFKDGSVFETDSELKPLPVRKSTFPKWSELSKSTRDQLEAALAAADKVLNRPEVKKKIAENRAKTQAWLAKEIAEETREARENNPVYQGLMAQAEMADREAESHERHYREKQEQIKRTSTRDLITHYTQQMKEHRAHSALARERAKSFRDAANKLS